MNKFITITTFLCILSVCLATQRRRLAGSGLDAMIETKNIKITHKATFKKDSVNNGGTMVFFGSGRCGRTAYWAPKFKSWVEEKKAVAGSTFSKMTFKYVDCNGEKADMALCWYQGVRQYPAAGIYEANGKQSSFYQNSSGMKKLWSDNSGSKDAAKPMNKELAATVPKGVKIAKHALAKMCLKSNTTAVVEVDQKNFRSFLKDHPAGADIYYGSSGDPYSNQWCNYMASAQTFYKTHKRGIQGQKGFAIVDCDDNHDLCVKQGVSSLPMINNYRDGHLNKDFTIRSFSRYLGGIQSGKLSRRLLGKMPSSKPAARRDALKKLMKGAKNLTMITTKNFKTAVLGSKKSETHIFYGSAGCGRTRYWVPKFLQFVKKVSKTNPCAMFGFVDCNEDMKLCWNNGIRQYPTMILRDSNDEKSLFAANDGMTKYLDEFKSSKSVAGNCKNQKKVKAADKKTPKGPPRKNVADEKSEKGGVSSCAKLNKETIKEFTKGKNNFVLFMQNSKAALALAKKYSIWCLNNKDVKCGFINCDKYSKTCSDHDISRYPSLLQYKNDEEYDGYMSDGVQRFFEGRRNRDTRAN